MFADRRRRPKLHSEAHSQRPSFRHGQLASSPFQKRLHSKSPSSPRLSSLSPHHKPIKGGSRLFMGAHLPNSGETYLVGQPSQATEVRRIVRAFSNQDMRVAHSLKHPKMDISSQYAIKITAEPSLSSLSLIINQFQEGGFGKPLAEVLESSGESLRIDSNLSSDPGDFLQI